MPRKGTLITVTFILLICSTLIPCQLVLRQYLPVYSHVLVLVLTCFIVTQIEEELSSLLTDAGSDADTTSRHSKFTLLSSCSQIINMYTELSRTLLQHSWTIVRNSAKLLSILYNIFTHLASKVSLSLTLDQNIGPFFNTKKKRPMYWCSLPSVNCWRILAMLVNDLKSDWFINNMKYTSIKL